MRKQAGHIGVPQDGSSLADRRLGGVLCLQMEVGDLRVADIRLPCLPRRLQKSLCESHSKTGPHLRLMSAPTPMLQ